MALTPRPRELEGELGRLPFVVDQEKDALVLTHRLDDGVLRGRA